MKSGEYFIGDQYSPIYGGRILQICCPTYYDYAWSFLDYFSSRSVKNDLEIIDEMIFYSWWIPETEINSCESFLRSLDFTKCEMNDLESEREIVASLLGTT